MANLLPNLRQKFWDNNGLPLAGGKIYTYQAGTTTPLATYTDATGGTPLSNPIILNADGECDIWLGPSSYKFVIHTSADVLVKTVDAVALIDAGAVSTAKIANEAVTTAKIADLNVTTDKLADDAVTNPKIADNAVTVEKIDDEAVETEKIAEAAVTPSKLADSIYSQVFFERSKFINGDMNFWQRGTSFAAASNGAFTADRWRFAKSGAAVFTVSQSTTVPSFTESGYNFTYSLKLACTTADVALGATDLVEIGQPIEGSFFNDLIKKATVLTFWIRSQKTGTLCVCLKNKITINSPFQPTKSYVTTVVIAAADTWQKVTIAVPAPNDGTWNTDVTTGFYVGVVLMAGSTYHTTANAWQNGDYSGVSTMDNYADSTSNEVYITGMRLEGGSVARQYESRPAAIEDLLCRRYYEIITAKFRAYNPNVNSTGAIGGVIGYNIGKPVAPSVTITTNTLTRVDTPAGSSGLYGVDFSGNFISGSAGPALMDLTAKLDSELTA
jgi:hypothetical protein